MKLIKISLVGDNECMYHTKKITTPIGINQEEGGRIELTVWYPEKNGVLAIGDMIDWNQTQPFMRVKKIIENRDHKGFSTEDKKRMSFYKIEGTLVRRSLVMESYSVGK